MNNEMTMQVAVAIRDCFKDEDDRELYNFPQIESEDGNEIVLSIFHAFQFVVNQLGDTHYDPLEFISVLTRLLFQDAKAENAGGANDDNN
ncbi:MAG: hypothetical protein IJK30_07425 [Ruminococcus sp.]|nr:hypothetical protein [Ruminococcus sp.]